MSNRKTIMNTSKSMEFAELVKNAQQGCEKSMQALAEQAGDRLRPYLYRITLDRDLAEDLLQETLLQMVKSVKDLRKAESFWAWIYRIALGKTQHHFRRSKIKSKQVSMSDIIENHGEPEHKSAIEVGDEAMRKELAQAAYNALSKLKFKHRNVLVLRCFEDKPYAEIAEIMKCSRTSAQVLFFRAKQTLKKRLIAQGYGSSMLLPALGLFGTMTATSEEALASVGISSGSTKVSFLASAIGAAGTKIGIAVITLLVAIFTVGTFVSLKNSQSTSSKYNLPSRAEVKSFHFVEQAWSKAGQLSTNLARGRSLSKGAYEQWFYFPVGVDGPCYMMMQRWNPSMGSRLCSWMQNAEGNYYYHSGEKRIYVRNFHLPMRDLRTRRLPSDTPEFTAFLNNIEGKPKGIKYERDPKIGLLAGVLDNRFYNERDFTSSFEYNNLSEKDFDNFRYPWPKDAEVIDNRDAMHKRGWTRFFVFGEIQGQKVSGRGEIPFVYHKFKEHKPWLDIWIGQQLRITDTSKGGCVSTGSFNNIETYYAPQVFFAGLSQPWMGMHAVDTVRRSAAKQRIKFGTKKSDDGKSFIITLFVPGPNGVILIVYTIDLHNDLVERIDFYKEHQSGRSEIGCLSFDYQQQIDPESTTFITPDINIRKNDQYSDSLGITWLAKFAQGNL